MSVATIREILNDGDAPPSLYSTLAKKWTVPPQSLNESRRSRTDFDIEIGATAESGAAILFFLASLVSRRSAGLDKLALAVVSGAGAVDLVHSLFLVSGSEYDEDIPEVWGIVGEIPDEGFPTLTKLTPMLFSANTTFTGTSPSQFEAHATSLSSTDPRHFESNAHQPATSEDEGSRLLSSRGTAFLPVVAALAILDLGAGASIAKVAQRAFPIVNASETTSFDAASNWLQASFTSTADGAYVSGPIHTRRNRPLVTTTEGSFRHTVTV